MSHRPRVVVVDDSAFARTMLSRVLRASGTIDVVATARDGRDALERIAALDPDVITLDLTMPELDGIGVLRALAGRPRPRVLVVSISSIDTDLGVDALALGAADVITKPTALASDRLQELGDELIAKVMAVSREPGPPLTLPLWTRPVRAPAQLIMIGTSTGGPPALTMVMAGLPATLSAPVAVVLHIPYGYTQALAARLDKLTPLHVVEAHDGLALVPGLVVVARGGMHLRVERDGAVLQARLAALPPQPFVPSVNELFRSGAAAVGAGALGVVLTGMGDDGLEGAATIAAAGGSLLTEAASTCVVYGMPRSVYDAGLGAEAVPLDRMAREIARRA
ncbi:MAG: chemotaxis-specific protein-glutamate methyltransferase CheB [Deltaproteobacteria bacterium]|nr:MAG: chemotaxis-specific protein-glutamate methyltransferase CheB [Deltaproteobacteria bacterium]TMQ21133.1 MAG: chemotaxis-specific protein-glutamate methyltransferase CheB [Deltaproteobacteria bacterium]